MTKILITISRLLMPIMVIVAIACVAGLFSTIDFKAELCSHFYAQYFVLLFLYLVVLLLLKRWKFAMLVLPFVLICLIKVTPIYFPRTTTNSTGPVIRVLTVNVNTQNRRYKDVIQCINKYHPDIISVEEVNQWWVNTLKENLDGEYPYQIAKPLEDNFGIAQFSKLPFVQNQIFTIGRLPVPCIWAKYQLDGMNFSVLSVHVLPPSGPMYSGGRNDQLMALEKLRAQLGERLIIQGDLNCTYYSDYFQQFLAKTGTYDSMQGFGLQPSWPSISPFYPFLLIGIDHILPTSHFACTKREVGSLYGSDHFPVYAELQIVK